MLKAIRGNFGGFFRNDMNANHVTNHPELRTRFQTHLEELKQSGIQPFCELPSPSGRCPYSGLKRSYILTLPRLSGNLVQIVKISQPNAKRGKLFLSPAHLLAFMRSVADIQRGESQDGGVH